MKNFFALQINLSAFRRLTWACLFLVSWQSNLLAQQGEALNFDGVNDWVQIPFTEDFNSQQFTVEGWVKPTSGMNCWARLWGTENNVNDMVVKTYCSERFSFWPVINGNFVPVEDPNNWVSGQWYHIAGVVDGSFVRLFVNGVQVAATPYSGSVTVDNGVRYIGRSYSSSEIFRGDFDEVRFWNRALCQGEIANSMNCEISGPRAGLVANFHLNQGAAGGNNSGVITATDDSGNGNHGTLTNFALTGATSNWTAPGAVTTGVSCVECAGADDDGDGYIDAACGGCDCDDNQADINPGMPENLTNGIDDNCDGLIDIVPYCSPSMNQPCIWMWIGNVTIGSINNSSGCSGGYSDYSSLSTIVEPGLEYTISIEGGGNWNQYATVWVDWNIDGDFGDAGEEVLTDYFLPYYEPSISATFNVPADAGIGNYRMRVVSEWAPYGSPTDPCYTTYGEVEDYSLIIFCNDTDSDGICDEEDNCPTIANTYQTDTDGDGQGDACDTDDDNDGCLDGSDAHPLTYSPDSDCDGIHDDCDVCPGGDDNGPCNATTLPPLNTLPPSWLCPNNGNNEKITVCHDGTTLCVSEAAAATHLAHGDFLGPCSSCPQNMVAPNGGGITSLGKHQMRGFELFPNPTSSKVTVSLEGVAGARLLSVFDVMGREILRQNIEEGAVQLDLELPDGQFASGKYFVKVVTPEEVLTKGLIITK